MFPPRSAGSAPFRPRIALSLCYLCVFFILFALLAIAPELLRVLQEVPPGPAQEQAAREIAHASAGPRLPLAFAAALGCVAWGGRSGWLPGLRTSA